MIANARIAADLENAASTSSSQKPKAPLVRQRSAVKDAEAALLAAASAKVIWRLKPRAALKKLAVLPENDETL